MSTHSNNLPEKTGRHAADWDEFTETEDFVTGYKQSQGFRIATGKRVAS
jgi:hypothetical protein